MFCEVYKIGCNFGKMYKNKIKSQAANCTLIYQKVLFIIILNKFLFVAVKIKTIDLFEIVCYLTLKVFDFERRGEEKR